MTAITSKGIETLLLGLKRERERLRERLREREDLEKSNMSRKHCSHLADAPSPHTQISTTFASHGQLSRKVTNNDTASVTATQAASTEHIRTHQNTSSAESHGSDRGVVICPSWLGILGVLAHLGSSWLTDITGRAVGALRRPSMLDNLELSRCSPDVGTLEILGAFEAFEAFPSRIACIAAWRV